MTTIDKNFYRSLGKYLRRNREVTNRPLSDFSKKIGISRSLLNNYELGKTRIPEKNWDKICEVYGIRKKLNIDNLFGA